MTNDLKIVADRRESDSRCRPARRPRELCGTRARGDQAAPAIAAGRREHRIFALSGDA
jgi:hypothetical protein